MDSPLPIRPCADPIDRDIGYCPTAGAYDPRWMLAGRQTEDGGFEKGFFDVGSWTETLAGWAKNVIAGRARIGGIPIGIICVETR